MILENTYIHYDGIASRDTHVLYTHKNARLLTRKSLFKHQLIEMQTCVAQLIRFELYRKPNQKTEFPIESEHLN